VGGGVTNWRRLQDKPCKRRDKRHVEVRLYGGEDRFGRRKVKEGKAGEEEKVRKTSHSTVTP